MPKKTPYLPDDTDEIWEQIAGRLWENLPFEFQINEQARLNTIRIIEAGIYDEPFPDMPDAYFEEIGEALLHVKGVNEETLDRFRQKLRDRHKPPAPSGPTFH